MRISPCKYYLRQFLLLLCALCATIGARAQYEVSTGIETSYPVLLNSSNTKLNYGQISFGLKAGIAYKPANTQFFPILNVSFGRTRLPLQQFETEVAGVNFNYLNVMLNENYVIHGQKSELYIYGGIGFSYLVQKGLTLSGKNAGRYSIVLDSTANVNRAFPAINVGFEYNYGESVDKPLYLTMGINFQYILLLQDRNTYFATVNEAQYTTVPIHASLTGNVISPGFYIALHYLLKKHSRDSRYL